MIGNERKRLGTTGPCQGAFLFWMLFTALVLSPLQAIAHPPTALVLSYNAAAQVLTVEITHRSANPGAHYIKRVDIGKNGKTITSTEYKNQPDQATFSYVYPVDFASGDVLEVTAACSVFGSKTEKLDMTKTLR